MAPAFVLLFGEGDTMILQNEDDPSADWFLARPSLSSVVRAISRHHARKTITEWLALRVAKELEQTFERLTGERVRIRAMKWTTTRASGPGFVEQVLHEIAS